MLIKVFCACSIFFSFSTFAQGVLDFADPCIALGKKFKSSTDALRAAGDATAAEWSKMNSPPAEMRPEILAAMKKGLFQDWAKRPDIAPLIEGNRKANPAFDSEKFFLETVYPSVVTSDKEDEYVNALFKAIINSILINGQADLNAQLSKQKKELDKSCKPDVVSQLIRVTIGNAAIVISSNFEAGKHESGFLSKITRSTIGVSLDDIAKHGLAGGPESEVNKALNNLVGKDSKMREAIQAVLRLSFKPPKIEAPNIPLPQFEPINWPKLPKCCKF